MAVRFGALAKRVGALGTISAVVLTGCGTQSAGGPVDSSSTPSSSPTSSHETVDLSPSGDGWLSNGKSVSITVDGGKTWTPLPTLPVAVGSIADVAVTATAVDVVAAPDTGAIHIYGTTDQGATWTAQKVPDPKGQAGAAQFVSDSGKIVGLAVTDVTSSNFSAGEWYDLSGAAWTLYPAPSGGASSATAGAVWIAGGPQSETLYRSVDSGQVWSTVSVPAQCAGSPSAYAPPQALADGTLVLPVTSTSSPGDSITIRACTSTDNGDSWTLLASTEVSASFGAGVVASSSVAPETIWFTAPSRVVLFSADGKSTVISPNGLPDGVTSIVASSATDAIVNVSSSSCPSGKLSCTTTNEVLETSDGGQTWTPYPST